MAVCSLTVCSAGQTEGAHPESKRHRAAALPVYSAQDGQSALVTLHATSCPRPLSFIFFCYSDFMFLNTGTKYLTVPLGPAPPPGDPGIRQRGPSSERRGSSADQRRH